MVETPVQVRDDGLYVESTGQGAELVLLHGWGTHGGVWHDIAAALAARFRVHAIDLPGHGYSAPLPVAMTLDSVTAAVEAALRARGIAGAAVVGWSLGGLVATRLALRAPARVARLVTVSTSPCFVQSRDWQDAMAPQTLAQFHAQLREDYRGTLLRFLALQARGGEDARRDIRSLRELVFARNRPDPGALEAGLQILADSDLRGALHALRAPVLILGGQHDALVPAAALQCFAAALPDARLQVIGGAAHAPFMSHPQQFLEHLGSFLQ